MKYFPLILYVSSTTNTPDEGDFVIQKTDNLQRFKMKVKKFSKKCDFFVKFYWLFSKSVIL